MSVGAGLVRQANPGASPRTSGTSGASRSIKPGMRAVPEDLPAGGHRERWMGPRASRLVVRTPQ
jgi:hypothetical protein